MNKIQRSKLKKLLGIVKGLWGERFLVEEETIIAWGLVLEGQSPEACAQAALAHAKAGPRFPPTPGEILQMVKAADPEAAFTPEMAWADAVAAMDLHAADGKPPFASDPIVQKAMEIFPPSEWERDNHRFLRPQFLSFYRSFRRDEQRLAFGEHLRLPAADRPRLLGDGR